MLGTEIYVFPKQKLKSFRDLQLKNTQNYFIFCYQIVAVQSVLWLVHGTDNCRVKSGSSRAAILITTFRPVLKPITRYRTLPPHIQGMKLTTQLHLVPRLRMCVAIYCLHHESSKCHTQEPIATVHPDAGDY